MKIIKKIALAKQHIKNLKIDKKGFNKFSKYKYFTPDQIEHIVSETCTKFGIITLFNLKRTELGITGFLTVYDVESGDNLTIEMATAIPEIKATNVAQQLGGCMTYTERYLKMSMFGITDNEMDFDINHNDKMQKPEKWLNEFTLDFARYWNAINVKKTHTLSHAKKVFRVSNEVAKKLEDANYFSNLSSDDKQKYQSLKELKHE